MEAYNIIIENKEVQYIIDEGGNTITGSLEDFNTGREVLLTFTPSYYSSDIARIYYDANWELIEIQILNHYYK